MIRDVRVAIRSLSRTPGYAPICIATFALVVGAAAGIFGAVDGVLLKGLPYPDAESVVFLGETSATEPGEAQVSSAFVLDHVASDSRTLEDVAVFNIMQAVLTEEGEPRLYSGAAVTWNYFKALRRTAAMGRTFEESDGAAGSPSRVVISDALWRERFRADPGIIGRSILLSGVSHEVVGVMPPDFRSPDDYIFGARDADIWRATRFTGTQPGFRYLRAIARRKPGVSAPEVQADLDAIRAAIGESFRDWAAERRLIALPL